MEKKRKLAYAQLVKKMSPKSDLGKGAARAFLVGGLICVLGQGFTDFYTKITGLDAKQAGTAASISLIFLSALLTGLGIYDKIGKFAGAGSIIPITGFANRLAAT